MKKGNNNIACNAPSTALTFISRFDGSTYFTAQYRLSEWKFLRMFYVITISSRKKRAILQLYFVCLILTVTTIVIQNVTETNQSPYWKKNIMPK